MNNTLVKRRRAANAIKAMAEHYGLGGMFDHAAFSGEDPQRAFLVNADEVRFTLDPAHNAQRWAVKVFLDWPEDGLATVVVQDARDLIRSGRKSDFYPQELGIPWKHPRDPAPEINVTVSVVPEREVSKLPQRKPRKSPRMDYRKPKVIGAMGRSD